MSDKQIKSLTERVDILSKDVSKISQMIALRNIGFGIDDQIEIETLAVAMKSQGIEKFEGENFTLLMKTKASSK